LATVASLVSIHHLSLEKGWLAQGQFKVTGWCLSAAWYFGVLATLKPSLSWLHCYSRSDNYCHT